MPDPLRVLLIGPGHLAEAAELALEAGGATVQHLPEPTDHEIREALDRGVGQVVVVSRHDHVSLRLALVVAHVRPGIPALVTIFDRDVAAHLRDTVDNVQVLSMADVVAPAFAGPCLDSALLSVVRGESGADGVRAVDGEPRHEPRRWKTPGLASRTLTQLYSLIRPFDSSARILVYGFFGDRRDACDARGQRGADGRAGQLAARRAADRHRRPRRGAPPRPRDRRRARRGRPAAVRAAA